MATAMMSTGMPEVEKMKISDRRDSKMSEISTVASEGLPDVEMMEVDFQTALQQLDAEFEGAAQPTDPAKFSAMANQGQPAPVRTRSLHLPEAVMELDDEFLQ
jgi:hypothetical protein